MRTSTKFWIILASIFIISGVILFSVVMAQNNWDFSKLNTSEFETNSYEITEDFNSISFDTDTANIIFEVSEDGKCKVECYEDTKAKHTATVEDDTLNIKVDNQKPWYSYIGINFNSPKVTVYLPKTEYNTLTIDESTGDVEIPTDFKFKEMKIDASTGNMMISASVSGNSEIHTSTGAIRIEDTSAGSLELSTSTGDIVLTNVLCDGDIKTDVSTGRNDLTDVKCKNLTTDGSTGEIVLTNVIATGEFHINRSTGSVIFDGSDANEIFIDTSTGSVSGTLLTEKVFITDTSVGSVSVPKTITGGRCEINTSTGSINIEIK